MKNILQTDYVIQSGLVQALLSNLRNKAAVKNVRVVETHISWVLLAGRYAYKIKKAVDLGFLNFSSLEARHFYCEEEIRLNRRLAPKVYLDVIAIGGSREHPVLGEPPAIEYAVRMRRFAAARQMDRLAARNKISPLHIDNLAATVARFHGNLPAVDINSPFGTADAVHKAAQQNFEQLQTLLTNKGDLDSLAALQRASENEYAACQILFEQRRIQGFVRECHGDLHLGNIVLMDEQAVPFDGIEFNPALRWIDTVSEVAFTAMDLQQHQRSALAYRFLNAYFAATGDYAGIRVLRFYMAYRAAVRAKVNAIRAAQPGLPASEAEAARGNCHGLLKLAAAYFVRVQPKLIITHGLPGSGKTTFSQIALERLQAIRLRSDVERKRMFELDPLADSRASTGLDLYSSEITRRTYAHLLELTRMLLAAGYTVIVDAAFIIQSEREPFRLLAQELKVAFAIASIQAGNETLRERILQRHQAANDASEADIAVLGRLLHAQQPLSQQERACTADFVNEEAGLAADLTGWQRLYQLLGCK
jgi:hypothetical protein